MDTTQTPKQPSEQPLNEVVPTVDAAQQMPEPPKTVAELESYIRNVPNIDPILRVQALALTEALRNGGMHNVDFKTLAALSSVYTRVSDSRKKLIRDVDRIRTFYLVEVILNQITEDALAPEIGTGDVMLVTSNNEIIQKEIDFLEEKIDFDQLALTITPDILAYGEYTLETVVNPSPELQPNKDNPLTVDPKSAEDDDPEDRTNEYGLIDLCDTVDQAQVVAITKWGEVLYYIAQNERNQTVKRHASEFVKFSLSSSRLRVDLFKEFNLTASKAKRIGCDNIPRFIRVGKSVIWPIIAKLKELELLEALVPATKISKLSSGSMVSVQVPAGYDINKAMEAAKQVEQLLNKKIGVDEKLGEITVESIMSTAGRIKVVPVFGGEKGNLSKMDYHSDEPEELLASVVDVRKTICSSVGIPYELVFGSDDEKKGVILRKYARYIRKLKAVQKAIEEGIRQMLYIHLSNKGIEFTSDDIKVEFYNKLVEVDNLDRLEFMDTTIGFLDNIKRFVMELADTLTHPDIAAKVDLAGLMQFINDQLNSVGLPNIIDVDGDGEAEGESEGKPDKKIGGAPGTKNSDSNIDKTPKPAQMVRRSPAPAPEPSTATAANNG